MDDLSCPFVPLIEQMVYIPRLYTDKEKELVLILIGKKNKKFTRAFWGTNFLDVAKTIESPNYEFLENVVRTFFSPVNMLKRFDLWNRSLGLKLMNFQMANVFKFLDSRLETPSELKKGQLKFSKPMQEAIRANMQYSHDARRMRDLSMQNMF